MNLHHSRTTTLSWCLASVALLLGPAGRPAPAGPETPSAMPPATRPAVVRCAVIGGMQETGFWPAVTERFEKQTGIRVEVVASGPKEQIDPAFRRGGIDLITLHASDSVVNLVADGFADDPQPWLRNDMLIVGPPDDPAGIKGETDAGKALGRIAAAKANFVVHSSLGAQEVLRAILDDADVSLDPDHTTVLLDDRQRRVLGIAAEKKAYTLVGRIPFLSGKLPNDGLAAMVQGDPRLRRPYLVAVGNPARVPGVRVREARRLAAFLRSPETQEWIATFGKGRLDEQPLFFPVSVSRPTTRPAGTLLTVGGEVAKPLDLDADAVAALPHQEVKGKGRDGKEVVYSAVSLRAVLSAAGVQTELKMDPAADPKAKNANLRLAVVVEAGDGYTTVFSLGELLPGVGNREAWLATGADGQPLGEREGLLKLIVPGDQEPARAVRGVNTITVVDVAAALMSRRAR